MKSFIENIQNPELPNLSRPLESLRLAFELLFPEAKLPSVIQAPRVLGTGQVSQVQGLAQQVLQVLDQDGAVLTLDLQHKLEQAHQGVVGSLEASS